MLRIFSSLTPLQKSLGALFILGVLTVAAGVGYYLFPTADNSGYQPIQPIPFSHKLHAGDNKIDCRYCHTGVEKSRHASIPALNVCMNCHSVVKTDSPHIQKIQEHYKSGKPIEWVRIHELPDFVYFTHDRHVNKGIACETCHGDIKSMETVYQAESLTMGFCVNCHRGDTTPRVNLVKFHPDKEDPRGEQVAPQDCSTCHY